MTLGHCERVRAYTDLLGQQLQLDADDMARLHWAALLHDVGKLDVPAALLNKKGKPTPAEWLIIRNHPAASEQWLTGLMPWLGEWGRAAAEHHERYDGGGYPCGLAGEEISLAGRIVAVADAFDVMTSARSYKKPYPPAQARVELTDNAGTQFDPQIVRAFLAISVGDLRRVIGPIAWLAAVPELLRVAATNVVEPARTAVVATGVAAAGIVPVVASPVQMVTAPTASIIAGAAGAAAGSSVLADDDAAADRDDARPRTRADDDRASTATTRPGSDPTVAAPTTTLAPELTPTTPPTRPGDPTVTPPTTPSTTPATTPVTAPPPTTPPTSPPTTVAPRPPNAVDDNGGSVAVGNRARVDVLANDTDPDGDIDPSTLKIMSVTPLAYRDDVSISSNQIEFRPRGLYFGTPRIVYQICDRRGLCDTATLTFVVTNS
jgi:hypothetical protein